MKDFNIAKYLRENHLGSHAILGAYVDLHALKEDLSSDQAEISSLIRQITSKVKYPYLGAKDAKELSQYLSNTQTKDQLKKTLDDLDNPKQQDSNSGADGECEGNMYFHPQYGCIREKKMDSGKNSETITLSYYDYPSIDDDDQTFAVETFIKFVKSLRGNAKVIKDAFDEIEFKLTGISAEEVKKAYAKMVKAEKKKSIYNPGPFNYLTSWTVNAPGLDEYNQLGEKEEMELDTEIPYEGPEHKLDGFGDEFVQDSPVEEAGGMDDDDSVNPFPSLNRMGGYSDEQDKFDRMLGLSHEYIGKVSPIVRKTINSLRDDGFDDKDIIDFLASDLS